MLRFAQTIREARRRRFLSQRELAREMGVRYQTLQAYEQGRALPHPSTQRKLIAALGLDPSEFAELLRVAEEERAQASRGAEDDRGQPSAGGGTTEVGHGGEGRREAPEP